MNLKLLKNDLYNIRYAILILLLYSLVMQLKFNTICPVKGFFSVNCPACGLTHSAFYILTGRVNLAISSNPTIFLWMPTFFLWIIDRYIKPLKIKPFPVLFIISSLVTLIWYFFVTIHI